VDFIQRGNFLNAELGTTKKSATGIHSIQCIKYRVRTFGDMLAWKLRLYRIIKQVVALSSETESNNPVARLGLIGKEGSLPFI
jgi:hypothetical protein